MNLSENESSFAQKAAFEIQLDLMDAIRRGNRAGANALLDQWAAQHGYEHLFGEVLEPTLLRIGEEWRTAELFTVAQAYVAAKVAEDTLTKITAQIEQSGQVFAKKGPVVIGNIEEDFHALGRRMVGTFLRTAGWVVYDLGNDVPPAEFVDKALEVGAHVIGVSAMMLTTARNIRKLRDEIDRRGLAGSIKLAVGGAVFLVTPGLVEEVGGDGTSQNAIGSARLFDRLWAQAQKNEEGI